jgi:hypothetical protein
VKQEHELKSPEAGGIAREGKTLAKFLRRNPILERLYY